MPRSQSLSYPSPRASVPVDVTALAHCLRVSPKALWFCVLYGHTLYEKHSIPKKSGGARTLHVPNENLAYVQRAILDTYLNPYDWPEHVSAYVPGRSLVAAAAQHAGRPTLIVIDLKDFFPSTRRYWVRDALEDLLGFPRKVAEALASVVCAPWVIGVRRQFVVPQGAPSSGAVANLVALHRLDPSVLAVCSRWNMTYTRYADDLAFSRRASMTSDEISTFIEEILGAIRGSGYRTNYRKIRVTRPHRQQRLLGLTINETPNIPKPVYRKLRAILHSVETRGVEVTALRNGFADGDALSQYLNGWLAYAAGVGGGRFQRLALRGGIGTPG